MTDELTQQVTYSALQTVEKVTRRTLLRFAVGEHGGDFQRLVPSWRFDNHQFVVELLLEVFDIEFLALPDIEERLTKIVTNLVTMSWAYPFERTPGDKTVMH